MTDERDDNGRPRILPMADPAVREQHAAAEVEPIEVQVGRLFARNRRNEFCYNVDRGKWFHFDGNRWQQDYLGRALDEMITHANIIRMQDPRSRAKLGNLGPNVNALKVASTHWIMAKRGDAFDSSPFLVGTPTGYVDLRTGEHHHPDHEKLITMCTSVTPAETADCPKWIEFMSWATGNDPELLSYLKRYFGYCLSGLMKEEIMTFLYGPGGNGKGVMLSVIGRIFGDYYLSTPSSTFMETVQKEHSTELARLQHRRLVSASETNAKDKWNLARIKEITGNENPISARFMRQDFFEFWPVCKLFIIGNSKPSFDAVDPAITRRLRLIEFTQTPGSVNNNLKEEFDAEFPAILRWIIDGFQEYQEHGLQVVSTVEDASKKYLNEEDIERQFIDDWLEVRGPGVLLTKDIRSAIEMWRRLNGVAKKCPATRIQKRLKEQYGELIQSGETVRYGNLRCIRGVSIKPEAWEQIREQLLKEDKQIDDLDSARRSDLG